jgi:hypothetical protein
MRKLLLILLTITFIGCVESDDQDPFDFPVALNGHFDYTINGESSPYASSKTFTIDCNSKLETKTNSFAKFTNGKVEYVYTNSKGRQAVEYQASTLNNNLHELKREDIRASIIYEYPIWINCVTAEHVKQEYVSSFQQYWTIEIIKRDERNNIVKFLLIPDRSNNVKNTYTKNILFVKR